MYSGSTRIAAEGYYYFIATTTTVAQDDLARANEIVD